LAGVNRRGHSGCKKHHQPPKRPLFPHRASALPTFSIAEKLSGRWTTRLYVAAAASASSLAGELGGGVC
jgi:hypothetical protein